MIVCNAGAGQIKGGEPGEAAVSMDFVGHKRSYMTICPGDVAFFIVQSHELTQAVRGVTGDTVVSAQRYAVVGGSAVSGIDSFARQRDLTFFVREKLGEKMLCGFPK